MADKGSLSDEERAELEQLRAEKAAREQRQREAQERAELDALRREQAADEAERAAILRDQQARERGRALMEPDEDDLKMPVGQKVVIAAVVVIAVVWVAITLLG